VKRVVLVRTTGPRNAGMALRACANFSAELWLVAPERPALLLHPDFELMAHGVENLRERVRVVPALAEALADCHASVAFTARARGDRPRRDWREAQGEVLEWTRDPEQTVALVFGSEVNGLTSEEVAQCRLVCSMATSREHTSLNLAMAVGIVLYELFEGRALRRKEGSRHMTTGADLAYLKEHLKQVLGGIARGPAARRDIVESIERVFTRAPVESRDARAWHKVLRALAGPVAPADVGVVSPPKKRRRSTALERAREKGPAPLEPEDEPPPE
jgi:TrmH family RNA methyltransferase